MRFVRGLLLSLLITLPLSAQSEYRHQIQRPANADSAWRIVKRCAAKIGAHEYPGGGLWDVKWFETTEWELTETIGETAWEDDIGLGEWIPPDTILLARRARVGTDYYGWSVAHELLHHLLRGPPYAQHRQTHPYVPFGAPCEVMAWQHVGEWNRLPVKAPARSINRSATKP
jgi:hypothetical protein